MMLRKLKRKDDMIWKSDWQRKKRKILRRKGRK